MIRRNWLQMMVARDGVEPPTPAFQGCALPPELPGHFSAGRNTRPHASLPELSVFGQDDRPRTNQESTGSVRDD